MIKKPRVCRLSVDNSEKKERVKSDETRAQQQFVTISLLGTYYAALLYAVEVKTRLKISILTPLVLF